MRWRERERERESERERKDERKVGRREQLNLSRFDIWASLWSAKY